MGNRFAKPKTESIEDVFKKDYEQINDTINKILNNDDEFIDSQYNFFKPDVCSKYTVGLSSDLSKHLKVEIGKLSDTLYFIPNTEVVHFKNNKMYSKTELCNIVASHYVKVLYVISTIKQVFDIENKGKSSLMSVIMSNINVSISPRSIEIIFCDDDQKDPQQQSHLVNFANLKGFEFFCKTLLSKEEKNAFLFQFQSMFGSDNWTNMLDALSCGDVLFTNTEYASMYKELPWKKTCDVQIAKKYREYQQYKDASIAFKVSKNTPILAKEYCQRPGSFLITAEKQPKEYKTLLKMHDKMVQNYKAGVKNIMRILDELTVKDKTGKYAVRHLTDTQLQITTTKAKKMISSFYLTSMLNYKIMLNYAKTI